MLLLLMCLSLVMSWLCLAVSVIGAMFVYLLFLIVFKLLPSTFGLTLRLLFGTVNEYSCSSILSVTGWLVLGRISPLASVVLVCFSVFSLWP